MENNDFTPSMLQKELNYLKAQNEAAYDNICNTIHCALVMQLAETAEKAFFARNTSTFNCYDFSETSAPHFNKVYRLYAHAKTYVYVPQNKPNYFVIFCVDYAGIVRYKRAYASANCMQHELKPFADELRLCVPMWHIDESVAAYYIYLGQEASL